MAPPIMPDTLLVSRILDLIDEHIATRGADAAVTLRQIRDLIGRSKWAVNPGEIRDTEGELRGILGLIEHAADIHDARDLARKGFAHGR
jgi:hypothetical protein